MLALCNLISLTINNIKPISLIMALIDTCVFRYESIDYGEPLGEYVYEINGLGESRPDQTFWALLERTDSGDCFVPTGSYITSDSCPLLEMAVNWSVKIY